MSATPNRRASPSMVSGYGQYHTNEADPAKPSKKLTPYATITLNGIRELVDDPQQVGKSAAQWVIPSCLPSRNFKTQEKDGEYWMLWADFDKDPLPIKTFETRVAVDVINFYDCEIYNSRSATLSVPKSRVLVPLDMPVSGADWLFAQEVFNDKLEEAGLKPDRVTENCGQLCYLPNRGEHYESCSFRSDVYLNPMTEWSKEIDAKRKAQAAKAAESEARRKAAQERRTAAARARSSTGGRSLIDAFNEAYMLEEILLQAGYEQRGNSFRHPGSESGSYSASIKDERVHSLSSADPLYTGGGGGGAHDAFSAFTVLWHKGDNNAALKDAGDNWLKIGDESWNKVVQREYMQQKFQGQGADFSAVDPDTGEIESDPDLPFGCEQELAERFSEEAHNRFRWSPGMDWMIATETHWQRDELLTRYNLAKEICRNAADGLSNVKLAAKICSASTANALLNLARSDQRIATPVSAWDSYPMLLNTPGGVIDLETGKTVSRDGLLFTQLAGCEPQAIPTPVWDKFILEVFDGDLEMVEFIQRMGGYCLTGSIKEQKLFFLQGSGSNGKSVFLDVLRNLGGKYSHNLPSEALMTSRNEGHPTMFAALHGKRIAISSEIEESAHWAESRIKSLTGDESLTARFMHKDFFTFNISHKHVIAGNFKPRLKGDDFAMVRRMVLVPFTQRFEGERRDNSLSDKLKAEYPGILTWFIEGARRWANSGLAIPAAVTDASKEYMAEQNDLELWLTECCKQGPGLSSAVSDLYTSFAEWKQRNGEHAPSIKSFSQRLERTHLKVKTKQGMTFSGVRVTSCFADNDIGTNSYAMARGR